MAPSNQVWNSSRAANRTFHAESPKSVASWAGIRSADKASASSGVNLYLKLLSVTVATAAGPAFEAFAAAAATAGGGFLGAAAGGGLEGCELGGCSASGVVLGAALT